LLRQEKEKWHLLTTKLDIRTGVDLQSVAKMEKKILSNQLRLDSIFTLRELAYAEGKRRKAEYLAARFAAKEAFLKALGIGMGKGVELSEIGIKNDALSGKPSLELQGNALEFANRLGVVSMDVSLSHSEDYAIAHVVLLLDQERK